MTVMAYIHSLQNKATGDHTLGECEILSHEDDNHAVALYKGVRCTAIYNFFAGAYFVDDIYGKLEAQADER